MKKMIVKISKDGSMSHETFGYDGSECTRVANDVIDLMGHKGVRVTAENITHKNDSQTNDEQRQMEAN